MASRVSSLSYCRIISKLSLALALLFVGRSSLAGTTYYVSVSGDDGAAGLSAEAPFATLAKAVATANGDSSSETVVVLSDLTLAAPVEITGPYSLRGATTDPAATTIRAEGAVSPLVKVSNPSAVVAHLTLSGGTAMETSGGNLWLNGGGTATNCVLRDATGVKARGGGVWNDNGLVTHCLVEGGRFTSDAFGVGIYQIGAQAVTRYSIVRNNRADSYGGRGGGIWNRDGLVSHCVISNNILRNVMGHGGLGGGIFTEGAAFIDHCLLVGNRAGSNGGGLYLFTPGAVVSNCTVVGNASRERGAGIFTSNTAKLVNLISWDNHSTFRLDDAAEDCCASFYTKLSNCLFENPVAKVVDPVDGEPAFVDPAAGDYRLSAFSSAIGSGVDGTDLGCFPFDREPLSIGIQSLPGKPLPAGDREFLVCARGGSGAHSYRWRLDDLLAGTEGEWTGYAAATNHSFPLEPGRYRLVVEAKDEAEATASVSRSFYVGAKTVYLVPAGTADNGPAIPYNTKATAANDIHEALLYCADGSELIVADGDYGVTNEVVVPAKVLVRSENGPEKTSIYRIGVRGKGDQSRVVRLCGKGATLSGFAVTNGFCKSVEDSIYGVNIAAFEDDTITNCIISDAVGPAAQFGTPSIAVIDGRLYDSVIRRNEGGGGFGGSVSIRGAKAHMADCVVSNLRNAVNYYTCGLGIWAQKALIERCVIRDCRNNESGSGGRAGGVYLDGAEIRDSLIAENTSGKLGGAGVAADGTCRIANCTIANNRTFFAAGLHVLYRDRAVTVVNTVFDGNVSTAPSGGPGEPSWVNLDGPNCVASHLAVPDESAVIGEGSIHMPSGAFFTDPEASDYTLQLQSPCRDKGFTGERRPEERDVAGNPRLVGEAIDIGAYEFQVSENLLCNFSIENYQTVGEVAVAKATVVGANTVGMQYRWLIRDLVKGTERWTLWNDQPEELLELPPGRYSFSLEVRNAVGTSASAVDENVYHFVGEKIFLVPPEAAQGEPVYPYDSWSHAATNLQMAVAAAGNGSSILATNGAYGVTSEVFVDTKTRLESVEGPLKTSIYRAFPRTTDYPCFRPVTITGKGAFFAGFTVSNSIVGKTPFNGAALHVQDAVVSNCVFSYNQQNWADLGGMVMNINGHVTHCVLHDNKGGGWDGYGVCQQGEDARTDHCLFYNNVNNHYGQGYYCQGAAVIDGGVLAHCVITNNLVETGKKGGFCGGVTLKRGLVYNCLIARNQAGSGAGGIRAIRGAIVNCTIVSNYVSGLQDARAGGIVLRGVSANDVAITNCIIYGNLNATADGSLGNGNDIAATKLGASVLSHSLLGDWSSIDPDAVGCLAADPVFKDPASDDWRLGSGSPCRDAGVTLDLMRGGLDLDGRPRVVHRDLVDLGCYEADFIGDHTLLMLR